MEDEDEKRRLEMIRYEVGDADRKGRSDRPMATAVVAAISMDTVV